METLNIQDCKTIEGGIPLPLLLNPISIRIIAGLIGAGIGAVAAMQD